MELRLQHQSSNEYSGLISFRIDCFELLAVQGTLNSLHQHHSSKASILWLSTFLMVQLSHQHMTTGKTIALTIQTFVSKVMFLLFKQANQLYMYMHPFFFGFPSYLLELKWQLASPTANIPRGKKQKLPVS